MRARGWRRTESTPRPLESLESAIRVPWDSDRREAVTTVRAYPFFLRRPTPCRCERALPAALLSALLDFGLRRTRAALLAAFFPVVFL